VIFEKSPARFVIGSNFLSQHVKRGAVPDCGAQACREAGSLKRSLRSHLGNQVQKICLNGRCGGLPFPVGNAYRLETGVRIKATECPIGSAYTQLTSVPHCKISLLPLLQSSDTEVVSEFFGPLHPV
jgi:hypothetical protein